MLKSQNKSQTFVLFWLGLLTGALLVLALYSAMNTSDATDIFGRVRYSAPKITPQMQLQQYTPSLQYEADELQNNTLKSGRYSTTSSTSPLQYDIGSTK